MLKISAFLREILPDDELADLDSMVGNVFEVTEIDEWGGAHVESIFPDDAEHIRSHDLMLDADEMELVEPERDSE